MIPKLRAVEKATGRLYRCWGFNQFENEIYISVLTYENFIRGFLETVYPVTMKLNEFDIIEFTGLTDKNGKEIYEGDIVHKVSTFRSPLDRKTELNIDTNFVVTFNNGVYHLSKNKNIEEDKPHPLYYSVGEIEVIGNIHNNPELLGENEK